jgi:transcriptional regulator with XRE-family HTH domain
MVMGNMNNYSIGKRVKELRSKNGLSQEQLALHAEITTAYLGQVEREEKNPTVVTIAKICNALSISLSDFFSDQISYDADEDAVLRQINFLLKNLSSAEKQEILQIIKHAVKLKEL